MKKYFGILILSLVLAFTWGGEGFTQAKKEMAGAKAYHPGPVPTGSSWVMERRDSGSFGSSTVQQTYRSLGEQTWQGKKVYAYDGPESTLLSELPSMKRVAYVKETTPLFSYDPPLGHSYPLWVGKIWEENNQITFHKMGATFGVLTKWKVEAQEEIKVPAGTFKVFRVIRSDIGQEDTDWWSPDLGISIKYKIQRNAGHPNGPGVRELELISYDFKK
jgi:hypothetical protein